MIAHALGGIGLFLIGMVLVTEGLRTAAGDTLRAVLLRFTGGPFKAFLSGAVVTGVVQSSSATTVATIGFVGAGLISFEQALGLIFGANVGTTATGWLVAVFGLKLSVTAAALPMIGVGGFMRVLSRRRTAYFGMALAGFGLILLGIDTLQAGMAGASDALTPSTLPDDTLGGRLILVAIGVALTAVMQSSSVAMAMALTALYGGAISLPQAAAMVIGINVGTTVTAAIAVIGASTAAKQTAFAHFLFNLVTGVVAFGLLPLFVYVVEPWSADLTPGGAALLIAGFHTFFNLVGVVLLFPFIGRFARFVTRVVRRRGTPLTALLDANVASQGVVATEAVRLTAVKIARVAFNALDDLVEQRDAPAEDLEAAVAALHETERYVESIRFSDPLSEAGQERHVATVHALNHLGRLLALAQKPKHVEHLDHPDLKAFAERVGEATRAVSTWAEDPHRPPPVDSLLHLSSALEGARAQLRAELLSQTAAGGLAPATAGRQLESLRWLGQVAYHAWRLADRLRGERPVEPDPG